MKLGWVQPVPMDRPGGMALDNRMAIQYGPAGWEHVVCTPEQFDAECDAYVACSVVCHSREQIELLLRRPHILWARDLWVLPREWAWKHALFKPLCESASVCLFASPLHRKEFIERNAGGAYLRTWTAMSMLDPEPFLAVRGRGSRKGNLWTGDWGNPYRGLREAIEWCMAQGEALDVLGYGGEPPAYLFAGRYSEWVQLLEPVVYGRMPQVYAEHQRYVLLPGILDPCGRAVMEAKLAGLKIVSDAERMGVMSFEWWPEAERDPQVLAQKLREAPGRFWQLARPAIEAAIKGKDG